MQRTCTKKVGGWGNPRRKGKARQSKPGLAWPGQPPKRTGWTAATPTPTPAPRPAAPPRSLAACLWRAGARYRCPLSEPTRSSSPPLARSMASAATVTGRPLSRPLPPLPLLALPETGVGWVGRVWGEKGQPMVNERTKPAPRPRSLNALPRTAQHIQLVVVGPNFAPCPGICVAPQLHRLDRLVQLAVVVV